MASKTAGPSVRRALHSSPAVNAVAGSSKGQSAYFARKAAGVAEDASSAAGKLTPAGSSTGNVDVSYLPVLSKAVIQSSEVGKAMVFSDAYSKCILDEGLPKRLRRDLTFTARPTTVLRAATVSLVEDLKKNKQLKAILTGQKGSGRSTVLLQAVAHCQDDGWLILHIGDANLLVDAKYSYVSSKGKSTAYDQPDLAQAILKRFLATNTKTALAKLEAQTMKPIQDAIKTASLAPEALSNLIQSAGKSAPLLVAIDAAEALYRPSKYLAANASTIQPEQLHVPHLLRSCMDGRISSSSLSTIAALDQSSSLPKAFPENGIKFFQTGPLSRLEAAGIYQHMAETKLIEQDPTDVSFMEAFVGSDGNAFLFTRGLRSVPGGTARGVSRKGRRRGIKIRDDRLHTVTRTSVSP